MSGTRAYPQELFDEQVDRLLGPPVGEELSEARPALVFPRYSYTGSGMKVDNSDDIKKLKYKKGGTMVSDVGAPGIGQIHYKITKVDDEGVWGVVTKDTSRVLDPSETR